MGRRKKPRPEREPRPVSVFLPGGPIDWKAWMAEASQPRGMKGRKMKPEHVAKQQATRRANAERRRRELAEAMRLAALAKAMAPAPFSVDDGLKIWERVFTAMEPGAWYATVDLARMGRANYQSLKAHAPKWQRDGLMERTQNPAWKPPERPGMRQEPRWLYRLTREGMARRAAALAVL